MGSEAEFPGHIWKALWPPKLWRFPRSPLHPINSNSPHFLLWRMGAPRLPQPGLCQDLCSGGVCGAGCRIQIHPSQAGKRLGCGAEWGECIGLWSPASSPQMSTLVAQLGWSGSFFSSGSLFRRQSLSSRSCAPTQPHFYERGLGCLSAGIWEISWEYQDERMTFPLLLASNTRDPAQLLR